MSICEKQMDGEIVKAGWLQRQSNVLKKWKKQWFTLTRDGILRHYDNNTTNNAEDGARMKVDCMCIKSPNDITNVNPPEGVSRQCLLTIVFTNKTWNLCAESPDDRQAWSMTLEESRQFQPTPASVTVMTSPYPRQQVAYAAPGISYVAPGQSVVYSQYPQSYMYPNGTVIHRNSDGSQTTVINQGNNYNRYGNDAALGFVAGAAVGSMMWGPVFWW